MRYVPLITIYLGKVYIDIYLLYIAYIIICHLYMAYIVIYLLYIAYINIINKNESKHQTIWTLEFLRGNPMIGEKTTEASLTPKIYFARLNAG